MFIEPAVFDVNFREIFISLSTYLLRN